MILLALNFLNQGDICHYEIDVGSFVFCEDVLAHAEEDKQNILHAAGDSKGSLTSNILTRAVCEVFGHVVKKSKKGRKSPESAGRTFNNLRRKIRSMPEGESTTRNAVRGYSIGGTRCTATCQKLWLKQMGNGASF